jgi:hypothetical protein
MMMTVRRRRKEERKKKENEEDRKSRRTKRNRRRRARRVRITNIDWLASTVLFEAGYRSALNRPVRGPLCLTYLC